MMKNQFAPNYINKLKMKKMETVVEKKKITRNGKLLNLIVSVKSEEELSNYEIYG